MTFSNFDNHPGDQGVATAVAGAATVNHVGGIVTSEALTTANGAAYVLTLTNNQIDALSLVFVSVSNGTNTSGAGSGLFVGIIQPAAGSVAIHVANSTGSALNGTIVITFIVF